MAQPSPTDNADFLRVNVQNGAVQGSGMIDENMNRGGMFCKERMRNNAMHVLNLSIRQLHSPDHLRIPGNNVDLNPYVIAIVYLRKIVHGENFLQVANGRFGSLMFTENMEYIFRNLTADTSLGTPHSLSGIPFITDVVPQWLIHTLETNGAILIGRIQNWPDTGNARFVFRKYVVFAISLTNDTIDEQRYSTFYNLYSFTDIMFAPMHFRGNIYERCTITARHFSDIQSIIGFPRPVQDPPGIGIYTYYGRKNADLPNEKQQVKILVCLKGKQKHMDVALYLLAGHLHSARYDLTIKYGSYRMLRECRAQLNAIYNTVNNEVDGICEISNKSSQELAAKLKKYHFIVAPSGHFGRDEFSKNTDGEQPSSMTIPIFVNYNMEIIGNQQYSLYQFGEEVVTVLQNAGYITQEVQAAPPASRNSRWVAP